MPLRRARVKSNSSNWRLTRWRGLSILNDKENEIKTIFNQNILKIKSIPCDLMHLGASIARVREEIILPISLVIGIFGVHLWCSRIYLCAWSLLFNLNFKAMTKTSNETVATTSTSFVFRENDELRSQKRELDSALRKLQSDNAQAVHQV